MKTVLTEKYNLVESAKVCLESYLCYLIWVNKIKCNIILDYNAKKKPNKDIKLLYKKLFEINGYKVYMNMNIPYFFLQSNSTNFRIDYIDIIIEIYSTPDYNITPLEYNLFTEKFRI